jgi:hypothetical protein
MCNAKFYSRSHAERGNAQQVVGVLDGEGSHAQHGKQTEGNSMGARSVYTLAPTLRAPTVLRIEKWAEVVIASLIRSFRTL